MKIRQDIKSVKININNPKRKTKILGRIFISRRIKIIKIEFPVKNFKLKFIPFVISSRKRNCFEEMKLLHSMYKAINTRARTRPEGGRERERERERETETETERQRERERDREREREREREKCEDRSALPRRRRAAPSTRPGGPGPTGCKV